MNPFQKLGDLNKLRQQAMAMQKALAAEEVVIERDGVMIVMSGDQKVKDLSIQGISNDILNDVINEAIRKSQELAAKKLQEMGGGLGGLLGGGN
jgi:nucleoid-associated protein EbfC